MEELVGHIITADGTWQYDDTNHTDLPRGTGTLIEGQQSYTFASEFLEITAVDILSLVSGMYVRIKPIHPDDLGGLSPEEYFGMTSGSPTKGFPEYYNLEGDSIRLWPAPTSTSCTLASGMRVSFKRAPVAFTAVSTTATDSTSPGLPSSYHSILSYMAAIPYCMTYKKDRVALYEKKKDKLLEALLTFYGLRERDRRKIMTNKSINYL